MLIENLTEQLESNSETNYSVTVNQEDNSELLYKMIDKMFSNQSVKVRKGDLNDNTIVVNKDGEDISTSSLDTLKNSILYTNSDQYKTQRNQMNKLKFPESILKLQNKKFELKGYPKEYNEKLILIAISRYIEQLSYNHGGIHHSTFQKLSRIDDEKGTKEIYESLSGRVDELHLYGELDKFPELGTKPTFHFGSTDAYKYSWIVLHLSEENCAALVAFENKDRFNEWDAIWTFDREKVITIEEKMKNYF